MAQATSGETSVTFHATVMWVHGTPETVVNQILDDMHVLAWVSRAAMDAIRVARVAGADVATVTAANVDADTARELSLGCRRATDRHPACHAPHVVVSDGASGAMFDLDADALGLEAQLSPTNSAAGTTPSFDDVDDDVFGFFDDDFALGAPMALCAKD